MTYYPIISRSFRVRGGCGRIQQSTVCKIIARLNWKRFGGKYAHALAATFHDLVTGLREKKIMGIHQLSPSRLNKEWCAARPLSRDAFLHHHALPIWSLLPAQYLSSVNAVCGRIRINADDLHREEMDLPVHIIRLLSNKAGVKHAADH